MDEELVNYLMSLGLNKNEVKSLVNTTPLFEDLILEEFVENENLLIKYGYPEEDISALVLVNPNLFVMDSEILEDELKKLKKKTGDIEDALKNGPYII